jgi:subtilase family serine protease
VTGQFSGTVTFGLGEANETTLSTTSGNQDFDVFLARYANDANLEVSRLSAPRVAAAGSPLKVTDTTTNTGAAGSGVTTTRLWLSQDATLSGDDLALGERAIAALAGGAQSKGSTNVTLPDVAPGTYYVLAEADGDGDEAETDESDNVRAKKILIGPDLTVKSIILSPPAPTSTEPTTVTVTVKNVGGAAADASSLRLYRSSNGKFDAGDTLLAEIAFPALAAGAENTQATQVTFAAGSYYVLAIADGGGAVEEANEANNLKKVKITVP